MPCERYYQVQPGQLGPAGPTQSCFAQRRSEPVVGHRNQSDCAQLAGIARQSCEQSQAIVIGGGHDDMLTGGNMTGNLTAQKPAIRLNPFA
jgi:hypothetical protein